MDEFTFRLVYVAFGCVLLSLLIFLLSRKMDRRTYLRPVLYGFFFAFLGSFFLGGGIFAYLLGGILVGYFLGGGVHYWWRFRAGCLSGSILIAGLFVPGSFLAITAAINGTTNRIIHGILTSKLSDILTAASAATGTNFTAESLLQNILTSFFFSAFVIVGIVAAGAVLGGTLRKVMVPSEKPQTTKLPKT